MNYQLLFIQGGGGEDDHKADARMVTSLQENLGNDYIIHYPLLTDDESLPDFGRKNQIENEISKLNGEIILVAHSLGASLLLKYLSENNVEKIILGIFLISTPFWSGNEEWVQGLKLQKEFKNNLPQNSPIFLYHCKDDEEVPFAHLKLYARSLPHATIREIPSGGHQLNNDLSILAVDIKSL